MLKPEDATLPCDVNSVAQLSSLPPECLNIVELPHPGKEDDDNMEQGGGCGGGRLRPLRHVDDKGTVSTYVLNPMPIILLVLIVETVERFAYYGVYYTQTLYLTGVYNEEWNAGFTSVDAASYVSMSTAIAYSTPFIGAILADLWLGDYQTILVGAILLYLPGLTLVALTTVPYLMGPEFNQSVYALSVFCLWPLGCGFVKGVVNVFGARQFHPLLQSSFIESYYVNFYAAINVGALVGLTLLPILAQYSVTIAYALPVGLLSVAVLVFITGTPQYVISKPKGDFFRFFVHNNKNKNKSSSSSIKHKHKHHHLREVGGTSKSTIPLTSVLKIALLIVPFCIAYSQMPTTFIVQGTVMTKAFGFIDAASMNSLDAVSVLISGYITGTHLYPALNKRGIKIPTTYKFAIGSFLATLSILWALVVESMIHKAYEKDQSQISVAWQAPSYIIIGFGEIFAVSAAYEAAFTASAPETKALASAINIFCLGGIPNIFCIILYQTCQEWFRNQRGDTNIHHVQDYVTAHVAKYFWVLVGILLFGIYLNLLPSVRRFVESVEQESLEIIRTPMLRKSSSSVAAGAGAAGGTPGSGGPEENTPLLRQKFGATPTLYKMGSMRAGPALSHTKEDDKQKQSKIKYSQIHRLYKKDGGSKHPTEDTEEGNESASSEGGEDHSEQQQHQQNHPLNRHSSM